MSKISQNDEFYMKRALHLARKGEGSVSPNPMVGAVLVKNGRIISEGYHKKFGGPHAEVHALQKLTKGQISGSTLYVTLEPCCFYGKTPPCANFLISKGVKSLFVAMRDPNPLVAGRGIKMLKKHGVNVQVGVLEKEAMSLNSVFIKNITTKMPFLSIKLGVTLDAKIATLKGQSTYITGLKAREAVHALRASSDAVLTTSQTVIADNPHLGLRLVKGHDPLRVVIDSKLRTRPDALIYRDHHVLLVTNLQSSTKKLQAFKKIGIEILTFKGAKIPLKPLMLALYKRGICKILVETGSHFVTALLGEQLADELILYFAPKILGQGIPFVQDLHIRKLSDALKLHDLEVLRYGDDVMIKGKIVY